LIFCFFLFSSHSDDEAKEDQPAETKDTDKENVSVSQKPNSKRQKVGSFSFSSHASAVLVCNDNFSFLLAESPNEA
jgi:hypothetical protein